ncbi:MAG TPA: hypothetical protein VD902_13880 [Symbiobacteriaceae bacterium]|nr:hypothetical protein [Symbiobacteriaceae bacterium]
MSQVYSTRERSLSRGQLFSSRSTVVRAEPVGGARSPVSPPQAAGEAVGAGGAVPVPGPAALQQPTVPGGGAAPAVTPVPAVPEQQFSFRLSPQGIEPAPPGVSGAAGTVTLAGRPGGVYTVSAVVGGLAPHKDPVIRPALWLICDLTVPGDLAPGDLAQLPRGASGAGNQPGAIFTVDGNSPTYGKNANTLSVAVSPGVLTQAGPDAWTLTGTLDPATNQAFHPLAVLGPSALGNIDVALPSGTVARILTDLFMRPATVHPELTLRSHYPQRLAAVVQRVLTEPGAIAYLAPESFTRAAVTLEGIVRGTPRLMPTREACCLMANDRT